MKSFVSRGIDGQYILDRLSHSFQRFVTSFFKPYRGPSGNSGCLLWENACFYFECKTMCAVERNRITYIHMWMACSLVKANQPKKRNTVYQFEKNKNTVNLTLTLVQITASPFCCTSNLKYMYLKNRTASLPVSQSDERISHYWH